MLITLIQRLGFVGSRAFGLNNLSNYECCTLIQLASKIDFAAHLFNDFLTNTQTQACPFLIYCGMLIELAEVDE